MGCFSSRAKAGWGHQSLVRFVPCKIRVGGVGWGLYCSFGAFLCPILNQFFLLRSDTETDFPRPVRSAKRLRFAATMFVGSKHKNFHKCCVSFTTEYGLYQSRGYMGNFS